MVSSYSKPAPGNLGIDQFAWYARMRRESPVYEDPRTGVISVFGYDDVQRTLSEHASFSSERGGRNASEEQAISASMISSDPPRHRRLRNLVMQAFTPRAVAQMEPRIAAIVADLLDQMSAQASAAGSSAMEIDFIEAFASPLPVTVIAELLGVPPEKRADFRRWSDALVSNGGADGWSGSAIARREMAAYFGEMIARRRAEPRDDLISHLISAQIDGQGLTPVELMGFCVLLLVAGNETTTNLLGGAVFAFDEHPEQWERLRAEPALIPAAVEEVLRYYSPVQSMFRTALPGAQLGEIVASERQTVVAWIGSANRDEAQFERPERFDITRTPNRHLAFGHGVHFCLGAPLARLEARLALEALAQRAQRLQVAPDVQLDWLESAIVYGVKQLPVALVLA